MSDQITEPADEREQELSECWDEVVELRDALETVRAKLGDAQAALFQAKRENQALRQHLAESLSRAQPQPPAAAVSPRLLIDGGEGDYTRVAESETAHG